METILLFISAVVVNNFVLSRFLGTCPFLGVSKKIDVAFSMGMATTFVMTLTAIIAWPLNHYILEGFGLGFLNNIAFILVIAALVQLVEMFIKKTSPVLYQALGIFLPLITTNCAILGLALLISSEGYNYLQSIVFGLGGGMGFALAISLLAGIREDLESSDVPEIFHGAPIALMTAAILAMAFIGFSGMISI